MVELYLTVNAGGQQLVLINSVHVYLHNSLHDLANAQQRSFAGKLQSDCKSMTHDWTMRCAWQFVGCRVRRSIAPIVAHHAVRARFLNARACFG